MKIALFGLLLLLIIFCQVQAAKTPASAIVGKLVPAVIKCFGKRVLGLGGMSKITHIIQKAGHGFDKLSPSDIIYNVVQIVAGQFPASKIVKVTLTTGQIIVIVVRVLYQGVGIGTAYVVQKVAQQIERKC